MYNEITYTKYEAVSPMTNADDVSANAKFKLK